MSYEPRKILNQFMEGLKSLGKSNKEATQSFMRLLGATYKPGALSTKDKEILSVGISVYNRCEYCIVFHTYKALEAAATRDEILEAAMVGVAFGGGPTIAHSSTLFLSSLDEFEGDFNK
ncbi:carboxymuconolactone decarboxylase family protein [Dapis sp. BLCC M126]|uniref:carboxymuconolactone decarboxylase family protein n=1 Tax=Dapis sp. BLCC M126 TaxID=3400189 RepID=UPI003CF2ED59